MNMLKKLFCKHGSQSYFGGSVNWAGVEYKVTACDYCGVVRFRREGDNSGKYYKISNYTTERGTSHWELKK